MTPEYASPEQILGKPVTTSTDIYALGVLLYELLTDDRPIRFDSQNPYALAQAIAEHAPTTPSEFLLRAVKRSAESRTRAKTHPRQLRGDLDRIAMMALRKEPERRYASAAMLAEDVRRYLEGRPVEAQVDSWHYRLRKMLERHPLASSVAGLLLAVVLGFSLVTQRQSQRIATERDRAVAAEQHAEASAEFLEDLFDVADPRNGGDRNASALDMLHAGLERLDSDESLDPSVRADMYLKVGLTLCNLEEFDAGIRALEDSVTLHESISGRDSLQTAEALHRLGDVMRVVERYDDAFALLSEALRIRETHITEGSYEIADSYNNLAILAAVMGEYRKSEELQAASIEMHARLFGEGSNYLATPLNNMALLKRRQGKIEEAYELSRRSHEIKIQGTDRSGALLARNGMARSLHLLGRHEEALVSFEKLLSEQTQLLGETHNRRLTTARHLAQLLAEMERYEEAERQLAEIEPLILDSAGERSTAYARWLSARAQLDRRLGDLERAERRVRLAVEIYLEQTGPNHFWVPRLWFEHGSMLVDLERFDEAEAVFQRALEQLPTPAEYPYILRARILDEMARLWSATGRGDEAARAQEESKRISTAIKTGETY
jgi:tetratricopeptide (TPR) repeat protein